jgi:hypothetical protein
VLAIFGFKSSKLFGIRAQGNVTVEETAAIEESVDEEVAPAGAGTID